MRSRRDSLGGSFGEVMRGRFSGFGRVTGARPGSATRGASRRCCAPPKSSASSPVHACRARVPPGPAPSSRTAAPVAGQHGGAARVAGAGRQRARVGRHSAMRRDGCRAGGAGAGAASVLPHAGTARVAGAARGRPWSRRGDGAPASTARVGRHSRVRRAGWHSKCWSPQRAWRAAPPDPGVFTQSLNDLAIGAGSGPVRSSVWSPASDETGRLDAAAERETGVGLGDEARRHPSNRHQKPVLFNDCVKAAASPAWAATGD